MEDEDGINLNAVNKIKKENSPQENYCIEYIILFVITIYILAMYYIAQNEGA